MKIGTMNNPAHNIIKEIAWIAEHNFDYMDLTIEPSVNKGINLIILKKTLQSSGLEIVGHTNPTLPAIYPIESIQKAALEELIKSADILAFLGAKFMNVHPFIYSAHQGDTEKIEANIELIQKLILYTKSLGVTLMLENIPGTFNATEIFKKILEQVPELKINLDIGHANIGQNCATMVESFLKYFGKEIVHLHIHDNRGSLDDHLPIGCGNISWLEIIKILKKNGYNHTITLEIFCPERDYLLLSREKIKRYWERI